MMATPTISCRKAAARSLLSQCTAPQYHRPRFTAPNINTSKCIFSQQRQFSQSSRMAYPGARVDPRAAGIKAAGKQARPSMKVEMRKMQKTMGNSGETDELIVKDLGLLDQTLIYPTGANRPSFTSARRPKLIWKWFKQRLSDTYGTFVAYRSSIPGSRNPLFKFWNLKQLLARRAEIAPSAKALHYRVYRAFAAGDRPALQRLCVETVLGQYMSRLARRPENERMRWEVVEYLEKPRLVSHRAAQLPMLVEGAPSGLKQCVVRIKTLQRLQVGTARSGRGSASGVKSYSLAQRQAANSSFGEGDGEEGAKEVVDWRAPTEKTVTEYVVIQRWMIKGREQPWVLWGFVDETVNFEDAADMGDLGMKSLN